MNTNQALQCLLSLKFVPENISFLLDCVHVLADLMHHVVEVGRRRGMAFGVACKEVAELFVPCVENQLLGTKSVSVPQIS